MIAVDLFSGLGGFTEGARQVGLDVAFAANHWPAAVEWHSRNHPEVHHECQDLAQMDMRILPRGGLLLAAPACQGHSSNGQPGRLRERVSVKHQADRNTAWAVLAAADTARPRTIVVENVPAFLRWSIFPAWLDVLRALGYQVRPHVLSAQAYGTAQERHRTIVTASLDAEIVLEPSVGAPPRSIGDCLEPSSSGWTEIAEKPLAMRQRMRHAQHQAGSACFWANVDSARGRAFEESFPTVTTKSIGQFYILDGPRCRPIGVRELARAQDFPDSYQLPESRTLAGRLIGNAIPVRLAAGVIAQVAA